jgi:hypothetical protein
LLPAEDHLSILMKEAARDHSAPYLVECMGHSQHAVTLACVYLLGQFLAAVFVCSRFIVQLLQNVTLHHQTDRHKEGGWICLWMGSISFVRNETWE